VLGVRGLVCGIADSPREARRLPGKTIMLKPSLICDVRRFLRRWARRVALFGLLCVLVPLPLRGRTIHRQSGRQVITKGAL
jgi:hypothetical protein